MDVNHVNFDLVRASLDPFYNYVKKETAKPNITPSPGLLLHILTITHTDLSHPVGGEK
jgi:hypothetical protein